MLPLVHMLSSLDSARVSRKLRKLLNAILHPILPCSDCVCAI